MQNTKYEILNTDSKYTLGEYSTILRISNIKYQISKKKIQKIQRFIRILSIFPQIKLIGLSGSTAMMNADEEDDVDLFIVSKKGRLWTARIIGLFVAHIMGLRRKRGETNVKDKVCLNLLFDESDMSLPLKKHTEYGAHEVLQMKPLVDKGNTYLMFLDANKWVFDIFPNGKARRLRRLKNADYADKERENVFSKIVDWISVAIEVEVKKLQLYFINKHTTKEIITNTQLWFFPDDFEKKISKV